MMDRTRLHLASVVLVAGLLTACGGGGGGAAGGAGPTAGIDGTGTRVIAVGTVTGFGSVVVNGVRYDTDNTTFTIDGAPGTQADLDVGDVVMVRGELDDGGTSGTADSIVFDDAVEGPIAALDTAAGTFVVLGQTVRVSADTSFDDSIPGSDLAGLTVGDIVEVTGFVGGDGTIRATRIELKPAGGNFEVTGRVAALDAAARTFAINALVVDFSMAMLENFDSGMIANGDSVEVKGTAFGTGGEFIATRVELKNEAGGDDGERVEIEGYITRFVDPQDFDIAGFRVTTSSATRYEGGTAADLGLDIKIEAEGELNANGVLVATEIEIRRAAPVRITALVDSVDSGAGSFVVLGITVNVDSRTRMEDKTSLGLQPFRVANLAAGDYVEVRGAELPAGSGQLLATLVEREELDAETELRGFVTSVAEPELTVLGVTVQTGGGTDFEDASGMPIGSAQFFATVTVGSLIDARGTEVADRVVTAEEVEIEND